MNHRIFLLAALTALACYSHAQDKKLPTWFGRWTESQSQLSASEWVFQGKDNIAKIQYWGNAAQLGGIVLKGKYKLDEAKKKLVIDFSNVFSLEKYTTSPTTYHQEWTIESVTDTEILLSRQANESDQRYYKQAGDKNGNIKMKLKRTTMYAEEGLVANR